VNDVQHSRPEEPFDSRLRQSRVGVWVACCFAIAWLLAWTVGTLFFDLMVATGLAVEFSGEPVFLALFSIPFNAVLVMFWSLVVVRLFLPKKRLLWFGTGIRIIDHGHEVRFRLPRIAPIWAAFLAAIVIPVVTVIPLGMLTLGNPALPVAVVALIVVMASIVVVSTIVARRIGNGKTDLVLDRLRATLTLPQTFGRREPVTILRADLVGIRVLTEEKKDSDGCVTWTYAVTAQWHDPSGGLKEGKLAELNIEEAAQELAIAIRQEALVPVVG
jgi:hypothetical protein